MKDVRHPISMRIIWMLTCIAMFVSLIFTNTGMFNQMSALAETDQGELDLANLAVYVNDVLLSEDGDSSQVTVSDGDKVTISFDWSIVNNVVDGQGNKVLVYSVDLESSGIALTDSGDVVDSYDGTTIGEYKLENNVFTITLDETATANKSNIGGGAYIEGIVSLDANDTLDDNSEQVLGIANKTYKATFDSKSDTGTATIKKSTSGSVTKQSDGSYTQDYELVVTVSGKATGISVSDPLPTGLTYVDGSLSADTDATASYDNGVITVTVPDGTTKNGTASYTVTYTAKLTDDALDSGEKIENTATINYTDSNGEVKTSTSTATTTPPTDTGTVTVDKSSVGDISYDSTEGYYYQDYKIKVTVSGKCTDITLTDAMPNGLTLIADSVATDFNCKSINTDNNTITIELEDGTRFETGTYSVTFRAKVDDAVVTDLTSVTNTVDITYTDPQGDPGTDSDDVTIEPEAPSISKTGSYEGTAAATSNTYDSFSWTITVDFGTLGLSLTDEEVEALLYASCFTESTQYHTTSGTSADISGWAPYDSTTSVVDYATVFLYYGSSVSLYDYDLDDYGTCFFTKNTDGTYSLTYFVSYPLYNYGVWGISIDYVQNTIGIEINGNDYTDTAIVEYDTEPFSIDKASSLDPYNQSSGTNSVSFNYEDVTVTQSEVSGVSYDTTNDYYYKEYTVTVTTPTNVPVSNIDLSVDLPDGLTYVVNSATLTSNGTSKGVTNLADYITYPSPYSSDAYPVGSYVLYYSTESYVPTYTSFDIELYGETGVTYVLTYRAKIANYDDTADYDDLGVEVTADYDLEIPYSVTLDLSGIDSQSKYSYYSSNTSSIVISDSLEDTKTAMFVDSDETFTVTSSNLYSIVTKSSEYSDSKYDTLREFLRNFSVTQVYPSGSSYSYSVANSYSLSAYLYGSLEVSRYTWTLTLPSGYSLGKMILVDYFSTGCDFVISYNALQMDLSSNASSSSVTYRNKVTLDYTIGSETYTDYDYVMLNESNPNYFSLNKYNYDSVTLGDTTYEYTDDNHIGWGLRYSSASKLAVGDVITITDTLPENMTYTTGSVIGYTSSLSSSSFASNGYKSLSDYATVVTDYDSATRTVTFTVTITSKISYNYLYLYFQSQINDDYYTTMVNNGGKYTFSNTAIAEKNGLTDSSSATKTITTTVTNPITKDSTDLSVDWSISNTSKISATADFEIEVNPLAQIYNTSGDTITITDTLPSGFTLDESSVKAVNASTGNNVSITTSYDASTNVISFIVPDQTYIIIYYSVDISRAYYDGEYYWYENMTNTAVISDGVYESSYSSATAQDNNSYRYVWSYQTNADITLFKYWNNGGTQTALDGAKFALYTVYDNNGKTYTASDSDYLVSDSIEITTNGTIKIEDLALDRLYKLVEVEAPDGYIAGEDYYFVLEGNSGITLPSTITFDGETISTAGIDMFDPLSSSVTITYENYKSVSISFTKEWSGDTSYSGDYRPDSIEVTLYRESLAVNREVVDIYNITASDNWTLTVGNLRAYDDAGNDYTYSISETNVAGYTTNSTKVETADINGDITNIAYTITNTFDTMNVNITKTWANDTGFEDEYQNDVNVTLYRESSNVVKEEVATYTLTEAEGWTKLVEGLPMYDTYGSTFTYTIEELTVNGYTSSTDLTDIYSGSVVIERQFAVTNTFEKTSITGTKSWSNDNDNVRPDDIEITLYADGVLYAYSYDVIWDKTTDPDNWTYTISDLPKYSSSTGEEIVYTIVEENVAEGYTPEYSANKLSITNNYEVPLTYIEGTKTWINDSDCKDNTRPDSIEIVLYANGKPADFTYTVEWSNTDSDIWSYVINDIPTRDEDGNIITYSVVEEDVPLGYSSVVYGFNIENTYTEEYVEVSGTKTWVGDSSEYRPDSVELILYADGNVVNAEPLWTDTDSTVWSYSYKDLARYTYTKDTNGVVSRTDIVYTVEESVPEKYTATYSDTNPFDITNTRISEVEISKVAVTGGDELEGASLRLVDSEENVVDEWISESEAHVITGLTAGASYTLIEDSAPDGYLIADSITFTVSSDGSVTYVEMIDEAVPEDDSSSEGDSSSEEESSSESESSSETDTSSEETGSSEDSSSTTSESSSTTITTTTTTAKDDSPSTGAKNGALLAAGLISAAMAVVTKKKDDDHSK